MMYKEQPPVRGHGSLEGWTAACRASAARLEAAPLIAAVAKQHKHVLANHPHLKDVLDFRCCDKLCCRCAGWCCNARAP